MRAQVRRCRPSYAVLSYLPHSSCLCGWWRAHMARSAFPFLYCPATARVGAPKPERSSLPFPRAYLSLPPACPQRHSITPLPVFPLACAPESSCHRRGHRPLPVRGPVPRGRACTSLHSVTAPVPPHSTDAPSSSSPCCILVLDLWLHNATFLRFFLHRSISVATLAVLEYRRSGHTRRHPL